MDSLVQPQQSQSHSPQVQPRGEFSLAFENCRSLPQPPKKRSQPNHFVFAAHHREGLATGVLGGWRGSLPHQLGGLKTQVSHLEPVEMTTPTAHYPLRRQPGGLALQLIKVRKYKSPSPPLLSPDSATRLGSIIVEFVLNRGERLNERKFSRIF